MEKERIIKQSFILTTSFSISSAQSEMFAYYKDMPHSMIELLVSLPSAGIMVSLIFNKWIERFLSERQMIVTGLVAYALCGFIPLISPAYPVVFLSRIIFGMAVGLLNVSAIAIISERYKGKERIQTLGIRGSAEVVGTAVLTFGVSFLIRFGWQAAFRGGASGCQDDRGSVAGRSWSRCRCGSHCRVQCHDHRPYSKCGGASRTRDCPNGRHHPSSHAICRNFGRIGLLSFNPFVP